MTVTDDDTAAIVLSGTDLTVTEGDAAGSSYTVKLATQPSSSVTVTISGHDGTDLSLSGTTLSSNMLTFTVDNWNTAQTVTVKAGHDNDGANDTGTLTHRASGGDYASITKDLPVTVTDDDTAAIVLSGTDLTVTEGDAAGSSYTVKLATQPTGDVTVTVSGHASTDLTLDKTSLTFTADNWNTPQTVTATAGQDTDATDDSATLTHTAAGADYANLTADLTVTVTDDDTAALVLSQPRLTVTEGDAAGSSYTVKLATQPTGDVTVTVSGHASTDLTLDKTSLTFTADNWNTPQTVTATAGQDTDATDDSATLTHTASGADYANLTADLTVTVTDDDTPALVLSQPRLTVTEGDAAGSSYTVKLATQPTGDVTVTVSGHASTDLTLDKTSLTFTADNWNTPQTVTVKARQDHDATDDSATLTHTASGADYANRTADLTVTVTDDDTPALVLSQPRLTVTESDAAGSSYTVRLATQPTASVTVTISGHDGTDLSLLDKTTPTFTVDNWNTAQTVTVKAGQDADGANDTGTLTHRASGGDYASITKDLPVTVTDDDTAALVLSETDLTVTEGDAAGSSYTVKLTTQPSGSVSVSITGHANTDLTLDKTTLTFTVDNWNTAQTVTVKAGQDNDGANDTGTLTHRASGGDYASITKDLPVTVTDDDTAAIVLSGTDLTVTEGDAAGSSYTVRLATQPSGSVTVTITGQASTDLSLSGTTLSSNMLTFTVDNWNTAQTVTVKAGQDADGANDTGTVTHTASGGDYVTVTKDLPVTVTDDDTAAIVLSETGLTVTEGDAAGSSYTVRLATQPSGSVTVTISGHDGTDLTLDKTTLTFTVDNWNTAQTVTVKAGQDADGANDTGTLTHRASGGDYASITKDLPVTVTDDDTAAIVLSETDLTVTEGDAAGSSYTVKLTTQPSGSVSVSITGHANTDLTLDKTTLTFTVDNWNTAQTVTVKAGQDNDGANDTGTLTHRASGGDYASITKDLPVTVTDDDTAAIVLSETDLTVTEGDAAGSSYTVKLTTQPSGSVTVTISGHDGTDLTLDKTTLTFTVDNWNTAQTVTVKAGQDADGANDTGTLTHRASGGDYASITKDLPVTVTDDDSTADCRDVDIWCATMKFNATVHWEGRYDLYTAEVDNREFSHNGADYQLHEITVPQNGHDSGDDNHVVLPFGIPERTHFLIDFLNLSGTSDQVLEPPNNDWLDWTLHVSTVSDGETLTATLRFSEARKLAGAWWRWSGGDIDDLRRAWKEGQPYKLRLVEDPRSQRTPQPLNPPLYLRVEDWVNSTRTRLEWLTPQTRHDRVPPVDSYKIQWKQSSGSWDTAADVSETTEGPSRERVVSHFLDGLTPGVEYNIRVIATDSVGDSEPSNEVAYTKPASAQQALSNTPAEGETRIDGIPELGQTLSADTTAIADTDGLEEVVFQYQWLADDADIPRATGAAYTVVSGDVGKAIRVRVAFTDDGGNEETLTSAPTVVTAAGLQLQSATVDGAILTLTYNEVLDTGVTLRQTAFAVNVNGSSRSLIAVGVGESNVLLFLSSTVEAGDTVTADYTVPDGSGFIRDIRGRKAASFSGQSVTNDTASAPLTARAHDAPSSHNGQDAFTFELRFSEEFPLSYVTLRDHAFTVTGGSVTYVRRLEPGKNVRWEITVTPGSSSDVAIDLNATTDCSAQGAICAEDGGKLSGGLLLVVPGPNTPATGAPTITGAAQVGETLTADTTGISDDDGLSNAAFAYQWFGDDAEINGATASTYTLVAADEGKAIKVRVTFTDDAGTDEELTSAVTGAVVAAPPPPNTPATGAPTITGAAQVGETLTADTTGISDDDGLSNAAFARRGAHQWLADDAEINGATASTYTLVAADEGKAIKVRVTFTDDAGTDEELTSAVTGAVAAAPPPPNTPATGAPTITGAAQVGETLTADTTGISDDDGLVNAAFAYQWFGDDAEINGATASTYTLVAADEGKAIKVRVTFTDDAGTDEELTSAVTGAVAAAPPPPNTPATGAPTITGAAQVGETLTADTTGISDDDGLVNAAFAYQWLADDAEINGATASTYTLVAADEGKAIKVRVTFTDDAGTDEELTSAATGAVAAAPPPPNTPATGAPTITGAAQVGETLTADTTGISDDDGLVNAAFAYQWFAAAAEINEATASTYTLVAADEGKAIKVRVTFTDDAGTDEELTSAATGAVAAPPPPPNTPATGAPTITGAAQVGETLTADTTGISDDDGLSNAAFAYQWLADDAEINGATASTYTLVAADEGKAIKVMVTFTDDAGTDEELTSAATGAVAAAVAKPPLTASAHDAPSSHNGQDAFTFELRFSEEFPLSYVTLRDHAFTVTGGSVTYVRRLEPGKNVRWEITITPGSSADVAIGLNATTDCSAQGAICTADDRKLSGGLELTVNGPGQ